MATRPGPTNNSKPVRAFLGFRLLRDFQFFFGEQSGLNQNAAKFQYKVQGYFPRGRDGHLRVAQRQAQIPMDR